ncbi:hypothetical protein Aperf_G00000030525 [Anoplocephala perfoliata]
MFYKVRTPKETQIFFEYYKSETDKRPRGCVDLNSCDFIYEHKTRYQWPNVFVVQTTYKGQRRDYLFSAETPEEMNNWITQLTKVLHMVPDQTTGAPSGGDIIGRNGISSSHFSPQRHASTASKVPSYSPNSNQRIEYTYVDRGLTEEYRTSFGEATTDDEDCYHILPQPDHAYVNLKGNGAAGDGTNFPNGQNRPDSVYFNVWDSSTVDVNGDGDKVPFRSNLTKSQEQSERISSEVQAPKPDSQSPTTKEPNPIVNETQLPKRCRNNSSSSSSSDASSYDEDTPESGSKSIKEADTSIPLDGAGEAEAVASSPSEIVSASTGEAPVAKPKNAPIGTGIQYLDAEDLDFRLKQRDANAAPLVPSKPVHLRRAASKEVNSEGVTGANANSLSTNNDNGDVNTGGYSELDVQGTQAFYMVAKKYFPKEDNA